MGRYQPLVLFVQMKVAGGFMSEYKAKNDAVEPQAEQTEILELLNADVNSLTEMFKVIQLTCQSMNKPWASLDGPPSKDDLN